MTNRKELLLQTEMCSLWLIDHYRYQYELYSNYNSGMIIFNEDNIDGIYCFLDFVDIKSEFSNQGFHVMSFADCESNNIIKKCTKEFKELLDKYFNNDISNLDLNKLSLERLIKLYNKLKKDKSTDKVGEVA